MNRKILSIFIFLAVLGVSYFIYRTIPSTPVLIIILIALFLSVLNLFLSFKVNLPPQIKKTIVSDENIPELESLLIYITPIDFANKLDLGKGKLWFSFEKEPRELELIGAEFNKLKDLLTVKFKGGFHFEIIGITTIPIGDKQFHLHGFNTLYFKKNNKVIISLNWETDYLKLDKTEEDEVLILDDGVPVLVFEWDEIPE